MTYGFHTHHHTHLDSEPNPTFAFNSSVDFHTLGDLHGNALYLLHFLITHGLARFTPGQRPSDQDLIDLGLTDLAPRTFYQMFSAIYDKPIDFWTDKNIHVVDRVLEHLEIAPNAHIRLLGDLLCDRGRNDYFTLKLLVHLIRNRRSPLKILLSNHDMELIGRYESKKNKSIVERFSEVSGLKIHDEFTYNHQKIKGQTRSFIGLRELLLANVITEPDFTALFTEYTASLQLLSYDHNAEGKLVIYSHAPINEIDILRAALCLVDPCNSKAVGKWFSKEDLSYLQFIQEHHPSLIYETKLNNQDLIRFINILNRFVHHMAQENRLYDLMEMKLSRCPDFHFGAGYDYPKDPMCTNPFMYLFWSRLDPNLSKTNSCILSECSFINVHGHHAYQYEGCYTLDGAFARENNKEGSYSVHVSRSQLSPVYVPPVRDYALVAAGAVLFIGIVGLVIARVCTGEIASFFALGSFSIAGKLIEGLPHAGVGLATVATYLSLKPAPSLEHEYETLDDGVMIRKRPSLLQEAIRSFS